MSGVTPKTKGRTQKPPRHGDIRYACTCDRYSPCRGCRPDLTTAGGEREVFIDGRGWINEERSRVPWVDHLAALERVRVEALREARAAVGDRYDWQRNEFAPWRIKPLPYDQRFLDGIEDALGAIDRLINAATTGDTDD
jgi:hypothetical protein